jgi:hypothetical protein
MAEKNGAKAQHYQATQRKSGADLHDTKQSKGSASNSSATARNGIEPQHKATAKKGKGCSE